MKRNYRQFYALLAAAEVEASEKSSLARVYSEGRTESLKKLTDKEWNELIRHLEGSAKTMAELDVRDKKRKKFIAIMADMGHTSMSGKPDMHYIYAWVKEKGCHKPTELNHYTEKELSDLIYQAEKIKKWYQQQESIKEILK